MTATLARRSAHGLTADRADPWQTRAVCDYRTMHLFEADPRKGPVPGIDVSDHARAAHLCRRHCPVVAPCLAAAIDSPPSGMVQGGVVWIGQYRPKPKALHDPGHGPHCWHLRGGR